MNAISPGPQFMNNHDFVAGEADWTLGDGWSIVNGIATCDGTQTLVSDLLNTAAVVSGQAYKTILHVTEVVAGSILVRLGGSTGVSHKFPGVYTETIVASGAEIRIRANSLFVGSIAYAEIYWLQDLGYGAKPNHVPLGLNTPRNEFYEKAKQTQNFARRQDTKKELLAV